MKYWIGALVVLVTATSVAEARRRYGMAGCGLGALVVGRKKGMSQILANTLNVTGTQSFGITTGTSHCKTDRSFRSRRRASQEVFTRNNLASLSREMSLGSGPALKGLHVHLGCEETSYEAFGELLQSEYSYIFSAPGAVAVLDSAVTVIEKQPELAKQCQALRG